MVKFLIALALACNVVQGYTTIPGQMLGTVVTVKCSDELEPMVAAALGQWNLALGGCLTLGRDDGSRFTSITIETVPTLPPGLAGVCYPHGGTAYIQVLAPVSYRVVIHEIGHALGLGHSNDPLSVMEPTPLNYELCQDDVDGVRAIYGLSPLKLDFLVRVTSGGVVVKGAGRRAKFDFSDGFSKVGRVVRHRLPPGIYTVTMHNDGFIVQKEVVVK